MSYNYYKIAFLTPSDFHLIIHKTHRSVSAPINKGRIFVMAQLMSWSDYHP